MDLHWKRQWERKAQNSRNTFSLSSRLEIALVCSVRSELLGEVMHSFSPLNQWGS
jgi:hypothetical protein